MSHHVTPESRGPAAVVGASMAGLLAARVLADHAVEVIVLERDRLPDEPERRRGVPQGRHLHGLLGRGGQILRELFPGIDDELWAVGAVPARANEQIRFVSEHGTLCRVPVTDPLVCASRPLLEHVVRRRVLALPNVTVRSETEVTGVLHEAGRVTGLRVFPRATGAESWVRADLVVDASGRAGRTPGWLDELGFARPEEETIRTDLRYVTGRFEIPRDALGDRLVLVTPTPSLPAGVAAAAVEDGQWAVTLFGYGRFQPSARSEDFLAELAKVAPDDMVAAVRGARSAGPVLSHHLPTSLRRRYDRLPSFPGGLLVIGDAVCSFNPIYGQGMTVAAQEALVLQDWLRSGTDDPRRYFREVARVVQVAWDVVRGGDLALPEVPGPRSLQVRVLGRYLDRLQAAACVDPVVAQRYLRVVQMLDRPSTLLRPGTLTRTLLRARRIPQERRTPGLSAAGAARSPAGADPRA